MYKYVCIYIYMMLGKLNVFNLLKWILVLKLNANRTRIRTFEVE